MRSEIKKVLEKELNNYRVKPIKIFGKEYNLYVFSEDEDLNIFEGFLFSEVEEKRELLNLVSRYRAPVSGYVPRLSLLIYSDQLIIKDHRQNKLIRKTLKKINKPFISKIKKALSNPTKTNLDKLFDRADIIEEFYLLYKNSREYLLKNIKGISEEEKREKFVDNFMIQMLTLWYLQERGFFNNDTSYLVTKFKELEQRKLFNGFKNYYEFLNYFFEKISSNLDSQYYEDPHLGRVVVIGPAVFLNKEEYSAAISIPDKCFYKEGMTDILITTPPKKLSDNIPLLNLFESRDWTEGNIDEFVLGAIYEKLITYMERKKLGAYYTPEEITSFICKNTIEPYLIDRINEKFGKKFNSIDQIIESNEKNILLALFKQLKEIKILDPAVGSAHFLESAINVLLNIYEKIWKKAKELGVKTGLEILAANREGKIETINLSEISDEEQFKLYMKFFIILSKNIYGVDINPSALKVAKARLFLSLAKHFDAQKNYFIRFPNVHFNLREGNSLVGYTQMEQDKPNEQLLLDLFLTTDDATYITESINVISELKEYLTEIAKALKINSDILKEVEGLNELLSKKKINWNDFQQVLKTKEKLIKILIASLNSQYARPLNDLLNHITEIFNEKLDEKFAEEYKIHINELEKTKTFHWTFEFPEVFLDKKGFDVVIGNPPWIQSKIMSTREKYVYHLFYNSIDKQFDTFEIFTERSIDIINNNGNFGFIVPYRFLANPDYISFRKYILTNYLLRSIVDVGEDVFIGVTMPAVLLFLNKQDNKLINIITEVKSLESMAGRQYYVPIEVFLQSKDYLISIYINPSEFDIIKEIEKNSVLFGELFKNARGVEIGKKSDIVNLTKLNEHYEPFLIGEDISRYKILSQHFIRTNVPNVKYKERKIYEGSKILVRKTGKGINATIDYQHRYVIQVIYLFRPRYPDLPIEFFVLLLNSKLIRWYYLNKFGEKYKKTFPHLRQKDILNLPVKFHSSDVFTYLCMYILFLNAINGKNQLKEEIKFFDRCVADSLIYELYFNKKLYEDGIYPEPKHYLLDLVSKYLKPINYYRWVELYWKEQSNGELDSNEKKEFVELEKKNLKIINEVYNSLKDDKQIQNQLEKIKSYHWVKAIEQEP